MVIQKLLALGVVTDRSQLHKKRGKARRRDSDSEEEREEARMRRRNNSGGWMRVFESFIFFVFFFN